MSTSMTSPMDWLSASEEYKYLHRNDPQESPKAPLAPISACIAAGYQHGAEVEEAPLLPLSPLSSYISTFNEIKAEIEDNISSLSEASITRFAGITQSEEAFKAPQTTISSPTAARNQLRAGLEESPQPPQISISSYTAAGNELRAEIEEAISSSSEALNIPLARKAPPVTPQRNIMKPYPSYMSGKDCDFSSNFLDTPFDQKSIATQAPSNSSVNKVLPVTPQRNIMKPHPSHLSGRDSDFSSNVLDTPLLQTSISSEEPSNPSADKVHPVTPQCNIIKPYPSHLSGKESDLPPNVPDTPVITKLSLSEVPSILPAENVLPLEKMLAVTPERNVTKTYTSYISGRASVVSSNVPDTPLILKSTPSFDPFTLEYTDLSGLVLVGPQQQEEQHKKDETEFSFSVRSVPELKLSDAVLHTPGVPQDYPVESHADDDEDSSSHVVDFPEQPTSPVWYEEPAVSPFIKSRATRPRRVTRKSVKDEMEAQQAKEAKIQRNLAKAKISILSKEWDNKVSEAVRAGAAGYTAADFARVVPPQQGRFTDNWLNDESVNGYLKLATKYHNADHPSTIPKSHAFSSVMLNQIATKGYRGVERWAKKAKIGGPDLLKTHTIFIPVNSGNHWTLMVVYPGARIAHYYDSMNRNRTQNGRRWFDLLKIWLRGELGSLYNDREWSFFDKQSPQQDNCSDCGVFAVTTAKMLILGADVLGYGPVDIPLQRRRIVAELVNGGFL
jgi:hypothetical protein